MWMCHGRIGKQNKPEAVLTVAWKVWQCFGLQPFQLGMIKSYWVQFLTDLGWFSLQCGSLVLVRLWGWEQLHGAEPAASVVLWLGSSTRESTFSSEHLRFYQSLPDTSITSLEFNLWICSCTIKKVFGAAVAFSVGSVYDLGVCFCWAGYSAFRKVVSLNVVFSLDTKKQHECLCLYFWIKIPIEYNQCTLYGLLFVYFSLKPTCWGSSGLQDCSADVQVTCSVAV